MSPIRMSKIEDSMRVVMAFHEALNRRDMPGMLDYMGEDVLFENTYPAPDGTPYRGKAANAQFWQDFFDQAEQFHFEIEDLFGLNQHCVLRWKYTWVDANGQPGHVRGVDIFLVREGLIREKLSYVKG